jgi:hypothetical protein
MEVILGIFGVFLGLAAIGAFIEWVEEWFGSINWGNFFIWLIGGGIALAVIFSFTAEGVLVIVGAYFVLIVVALIAGKFKRY